MAALTITLLRFTEATMAIRRRTAMLAVAVVAAPPTARMALTPAAQIKAVRLAHVATRGTRAPSAARHKRSAIGWPVGLSVARAASADEVAMTVKSRTRPSAHNLINCG
jgi:hypothetical protein